MSTTDPTGDGGGGGEGTTGPDAEQTATQGAPTTGASVPPASQQHPQQQQHPPPSPLSGCYLLVVLPEPHTAQHKDLILNRLSKGFLSWDKDSCHVDLEKELLALVAQAPEGEEARNGERLIQYATENLVTEVLIHPQTNTLLQCIRNLLASFTKHRHIIHAGYTFGGNGSWILQDGTFSLADFLDAFSEHEVQRVLRAYENSVTVDIHCAGVGDWTTSRLSKENCTRSCRVRVNPDDVLTAGVPAITSFTSYVGQYLVAQTLDQLMEPSDVVGNIRFSHPTLYVFPGGQGDAALFGINGFNMLVDGGFARKACFWDFTRHLDRLDAVLVTRINNSNVGGMSSVLRKKKEMHVYPQIGHFFCNLVERRQSNSPDGDKDIDPLILNLTDIGQEMVVNLRHINLRAHPCYRDPDPINLYHKVGHGTLDMYVLSPTKDSREVREFLAKWHASDSKLFAGSHKKDSNNLSFPIQNLVSICALLVWQPANPEDTITRILFPGSTPQHKIFEGFERLKHLEFLKHPVCSAKSLSPSTSLATLRDKPAKQKLGLIEREAKKVPESKKEKKELEKTVKGADDLPPKTIPQSTPIIPTKPQPPKVDVKTKKVAENKKIETEAKESKKIEKELKEVKKEPKKETPKIEKPEKPEKPEKREEETKKTEIIKAESEKTAPVKEPKPKPEPKKKEPKPTKAPKSDVKAKLAEKKGKSMAEKKDAVKSSPTTPKKTLNGTATKTEISKAAPKPRPVPRVTATPPAKSAKDATNRKVVEQKNIEKSAIKEATVPASAVKIPAKPKPMDRKPISRRTKPSSPSKARGPGSPAKSTRSTPTTSVKSDKDGVIRKVKGDKGTTDSSTVSTPSGIEPETAVKLVDKCLIEKSEDISLDSIESKVLADLKEEREVVEEIEAVLQKAERIEETRKEHFEGEDEITAEGTDKKEEDMTEEDVTADIEDAPKKEGSRKESQELTEEDEYLIVEKEEIYTEDSAQSGEGEQKHILDEAESEKAQTLKDMEITKEKGETEEPEEKAKYDIIEKKIDSEEKAPTKEEKETVDLSPEQKEQLQEEMKEIITSATEVVQKTEDKDDSGKKDSEDITKEPSSLSPDKLDSSEKKTTDTDMKPEVDQKEQIPEKLEESQERISTLESGATTTAPTLPEDERIPLDEIKEDIDEKHVIEEVKEKDVVAKVKEEVAPQVAPVPAKPDVKVFDVRHAVHGLQRDIVKTPDEVADLPVHEEVDPKLYRMEEEEKPPQETKEPPTPPVKEQKGVFSFFGKVADKFEKGIDKLTKKTKKDSDKDSDEKSSSKSSSPKEVKAEKTVFEEVDMEKIFPKVSKPTDKPEAVEQIPSVVQDAKATAIKETEALIQAEIRDAKSVAEIEEEVSGVTADVLAREEIVKEKIPEKLKEAGKEIEKDLELLKEDESGEDVEEVKALLEEASKKFKTVKDSLRDSLESLEEKIEEIPDLRREISRPKDVIQDTLEGVVEKLEEMKPQIESISPDMKEPEKVKFAIPKDEEFEEEYDEESPRPLKDVKEAVLDVGEVLAGTAGIEIDDKVKDVTQIVKKVAEVLKEDDFLSKKGLFKEPEKKEEKSPTTERKPSVIAEELPVETEQKIPTEKDASLECERKPSLTQEKPVEDKERKPSITLPESPLKIEDKETKLVAEDIAMPKKVGITEEFPSQEEVEEILEESTKPMLIFEKPVGVQVQEEPCVKVLKKDEDSATSPVKDKVKDKQDAMEICAKMMEDDHICEIKEKPAKESADKDVMETGLEHVCVKEVAKRKSLQEEPEKEIEEPVIAFEQKVSPAKPELVMVTPDSTPTSPKFVTEKLDEKEADQRVTSITPPQLPVYVKDTINKDNSVEQIIEELVITKKKKITIEIIEYITVVKRIPKERVIYIIEEIIVKKGLPQESVVENLEILKLEEHITPEKRLDLEEYIVNEYITKGKRITIEIIEEISIKKVVPKRIVIEIIEEIIIKRNITRQLVVDIPEEKIIELIMEEERGEAPKIIDISEKKRKSVSDIPSPKTPKTSPVDVEEEEDIKEEPETISEKEEEEEEEEEKIVDGFVSIPTKVALVPEDKKISPDKLDAKKEEISPVPKKEQELIKDHEKDIDDFEAVEQEYKVQDVSVTSPEKSDTKEKEEVEEAVEDDLHDVVEADEKFVKETKEKIEKDIHEIKELEHDKLARLKEEKHEIEDTTAETEISEVSEVVDTTEKYLDEAKEKLDIKQDVKELPSEKIDPAVLSPEILKESKPVPEKPLDVAKPLDKISSETAEEEIKEMSSIETAEKRKPAEETVKDSKLTQEKLDKEEPKIVADTELETDLKHNITVDLTKESAEIKLVDTAEVKDIKVQEPKDDGKKGEKSSDKISETKLADATGRAIDTKPELVEAEKKAIEERQEKIKDALEKEISPIKEKEVTPMVTTEKISEKISQEKAEEKPEKIPEKPSKEKPEEIPEKPSEEKPAKIPEKPSEEKPEKIPEKSSEEEPGKFPEKTSDEKPEKIFEKLPEEKSTKILEEKTIEKLSKTPEMKYEEKLAELVEEKPEEKSTEPLEKKSEERSAMTPEEKPTKVEDDGGTVRRMLVTASSEDGGQETEICPSGTITFTKSVTPDDSLKEISIKSTPDKDSLQLDKDSLQSGVSSPEKDSISEKSVPGIKDAGKITPEDSLDKSPVKTSDSQQFDDSLEKLETSKLKDIDTVPVAAEKEKYPEKEEAASLEKPKSPIKKDVSKIESSEKLKESPDKVPDILLTKEEPSKPDETTEKDKSPVDQIKLTELTDITDKPKSPDQKTAGKLEKDEKVIEVSLPKSPEPIRSEDISPAETIFAKSPVTEKMSPPHEKAVIVSKERTPSPVEKEISEKRPSIIEEKDLMETVTDKSRSPSITDKPEDLITDKKVTEEKPADKSEEKETSAPDESKRLSIVSDMDEKIENLETRTAIDSKVVTDKVVDVKVEKPESLDIKEQIEPKDQLLDGKVSEKSRASSIASEKLEEDIKERSKSPSEKSDEAKSEILKSPIPSEEKEKSDKSRSPSIASELRDEKEPSVTKSPSISSVHSDVSATIDVKSRKESIPADKVDASPTITDKPRSPSSASIADDKTQVVDVMKSPDKSRSPSVASEKSDEKKGDLSKPSSIAAEKPDLKDLEPIEKSRSPSIASVASEHKEQDRSKSPSIIDQAEETEIRSKSPSVISDKSDEKSKQSSLISEKSSMLDVDQQLAKEKSPSIESIGSEYKDQLDKSKTPSIAGEKVDLKDFELVKDKSRSTSIVSDLGEQKQELLDKATPDKVEEGVIKSKSPSPVSDKFISEKIPSDRSKSPSVADEKIDAKKSEEKETKITEKDEKSISSSIPSIVSETKEPFDKKSSTPSEKPEESIARSKSPSPLSDKLDEKFHDDRSQSPSIIGDKIDLKELADKSRSGSISSVEQKESIDKTKSPSPSKDLFDEKDTADRSKSPSIIDDRLGTKDLAEPTDKSRSPSVTSVTSDKKEPVDKSKTPSISGDKPDMKDVIEEPIDKSRSGSIVSTASEHKELDKEKSPPLLEASVPKSKSPTPSIDEPIEKLPTDLSKSPSITGDKSPSLVEDRSPVTVKDKSLTLIDDKLLSTTITDESIFQPIKKDSVDGSRSPSVIDEPSIDKSRSPSITAEEKPVDKLKSLVTESAKPSAEKSKSTSPADDRELTHDSKSPSITGDKDVESLIEKTRSPSIVSTTSEPKIPEDKSRTPSIVGDQKDLEHAKIDTSKSPSQEPSEKQKFPVPETTEDHKEKSKSPSPLSDRSIEKSAGIPEDKLDVKVETSRSPSIASEKETTEDHKEKSKSPSPFSDRSIEKSAGIPEDKLDVKVETSRSPSIASEKETTEDHKEKSKSPSPLSDRSIEKSAGIPENKLDVKVETSRSPSIASEKETTEDHKEKSKSPSPFSDRSIEKSAGIPEDKLDVKVETSRSPSIASEKETTEDHKEKSKSPSPFSDRSIEKSAGIPEDKLDVKVETSRSPSIASEKETTEDHKEKSKSPSPLSDRSIEKSAGIPEDKLDVKVETSRSPSIASEKSEDKISAERSKSPSIASEKSDIKDVLEQVADKSRSASIVSTAPEQKPEEPLEPHDKEIHDDRSKSPSVASDKTDKSEEKKKDEKLDAKDLEEISVDKSRTPSITEEISKTTATSQKTDTDISNSQIGLDKKLEEKMTTAEPLKKSPSPSIDERPSETGPTDKSSTPSVLDDKKEEKSPEEKDEKDKSRSTSIASEKHEEIIHKLANQSLPDTESQKSEITETKSSRGSSPVSEPPKDRSRSHSLFETGEKTPLGRSRAASLYEDKVPEKLSLHEDVERAFDADTKAPLDEKDEIHILSAQADLKKSQLDLLDKDEDVSEVTPQKKQEIERYIIEEFVNNKKKITSTIVKEIALVYEVPQLIITDIIEDIIAKKKIPRESVVDFKDTEEDDAPGENESINLLMEIEEYIMVHVMDKHKKINSKAVDELAALKSVPRRTVVKTIEEIIIRRHIPRNSLIEGDIEDTSDEKLDVPDSKRSSMASLSSHEHGEDHGRFRRDLKLASKSPSLSPEPIPSDKSTQDSPARSEPHIDEEVSISEEKRVEVENLLVEEYIKKGRKITEVLLEAIVIRTSLPRYIILEILEEIIMKRNLSSDVVIDPEIYQDDELEESYDRVEYYEKDSKYHLPDVSGKSPVDYKMEEYSQMHDRQMPKSIGDYPLDYESQFHKAFVGGMTEIRTTHITTLSGKSTPDFGARDGTPDSSSELPASEKPDEKLGKSDKVSSDRISPVSSVDTKTTTTTSTLEKSEPKLEPDKISDAKMASETQKFESISKEIISKDKPEETIDVTKDIAQEDQSETITKIIRREVVEESEPESVTKIIKREIVQHDEPETVTKVVKREVIEQDEPEIITKVIKREIIEQDDPEVVTKIIKREIIIPEGEDSDKREHETLKKTVTKEETPEVTETVTTKTTKTIVTEDLTDTRDSSIDKSGSSHETSPEEGSRSADVKRIITTVTTITGPDGKVTTKKDVKETSDTVETDKLEQLIDSTETSCEALKTEKIIKETITTLTSTSGSSTPDAKAFYDSGKSTPDSKQDDKSGKDILDKSGEKFESAISPLVRDLISDDKSYSGKSSPDMSLPKDIVFSGSTGKSTPEIPVSPLIRDGATVQPYLSGRSTPDRRSEGRSTTATPEGFRSGEVIRTIITTTRTISDDGEVITTTKEVTEATNEKGETVILSEKSGYKVDDRLTSKDAAETAISTSVGSIKTSELSEKTSPTVDVKTEKDSSQPIDSSSPDVRTGAQIAGSNEERGYQGTESPDSSLSLTSQAAYSPQPARRSEHSPGKEEMHKPVEFSAAAMSSSFYGELPEEPLQMMKSYHAEVSTHKSSDPMPIQGDFSFKKFTVEKEYAGGYEEKLDAKKYVDEADMDFEKALMEHKDSTESAGSFSIEPRYTNGSARQELSAESTEEERPPSLFHDESRDVAVPDTGKDPLEGWGTPLGLPSPKPPRKFNLKNPIQPSVSNEITSGTLNFDVVNDWGEPLRLPSPAPVANEISNKGTPSTPKKEKKQAKKVLSENIKNKKRSESPGRNEKKLKDSKNKIQPVYVDLTYVPHHGNSYYTSLEFFKRVRARYYVFSGTEPSREVYDALLEAKKTWEDKDLEVTMIPTYDTDTLGYWVADNEEALAANHIDLSPSASRCTINLQDHETSCSAYRLEF